MTTALERQRAFQEKRRLAREQEAKRKEAERQRQAQLSKLTEAERRKLKQQQAQTIKAEMLRLKIKQREPGRSRSSQKELRARRLSLSLQLQEAKRTGKILDLARVEAIAKAREQKRARQIKLAPAKRLAKAQLKQAQKISKLDENRAKDILREVQKTGKITREQSKRFQALGFDERQLTKVAVERIAEKKLEKAKVKVVAKPKATTKDFRDILKQPPSIEKIKIEKETLSSLGSKIGSTIKRVGGAVEYIAREEALPAIRGFLATAVLSPKQLVNLVDNQNTQRKRLEKIFQESKKTGDFTKYNKEVKKFDKFWQSQKKDIETANKRFRNIGIEVDASKSLLKNRDVQKFLTNTATIVAFEAGLPVVAKGATKLLGAKVTNFAMGGLAVSVIGKSYKDALVKNTPQADANALINTVFIASALKGIRLKPTKAKLKSFKKALLKVKQSKTTSEKFKNILDDLYNIKIKKGQQVNTQTINKFNNNVKSKGLPKAKKDLAKELAEFEAERIAKTTKTPKLKKADDIKRFIDINKKNTAKLENLLEDNFGTANFKKYRKLVEQKTGKKVLVRQTKLKQIKVKGGKAKVQTRTKVNIVDKKSPKLQLKKGESIKRIDVSDDLFIKNLDEVKKASKEIDFKLNQGRAEEVAKSINKWDKKGSLKLVNTNKRRSFARRVKNKARREFNDAKDVYKLAKNNFNKASKRLNQLSAKQRKKDLTINQRKIVNKQRIELRKSLKTMAKTKKSLIDLEKMLRAVALGIKNLFAKDEISSQDLAKLSDLNKAISEAQDLKKAIEQDLKKAQIQEQALKQPLKPKPKKKPSKPTKKATAKTTVVKKVIKPVKKSVVKIKPKVIKKIKKKVVKKAPIVFPRLDFDSSRLKDKVALFIGKYRERQNPRKPFNKRTNKVVVKTLRIKDTKNRALKKVSDLADNKAIRSIDIKLVGITTTKKKDIKTPKTLSKFRTTKSKLKDRLNLVEKAKHTLDKKTERRELASLKKKKKRTTKKKVKVVRKKKRRL